MKNIYKIFAVILVLLASAHCAFAQKAFNFAPDATLNVSDSVVIRLNDYEGTIQWQKSLDLDVWQNIPGATRDTLLFVADTTSYFRAEVIAGDCDPFYSDTAMIGVFRIITLSLTDITDISAKSGGNVIADGGASITARGVVWSSSPNPTIDNNQGLTTDGSGLGAFTSNLTGLTPETLYYIRAYATNSVDTGYGQQEDFTTEDSGGGNGDWPTDTVTQVVEVLNPTTGKTWMDRNLGASRAATSSTDAEAYGDLYQWGRAADGHQKRTSGTTSTLSNSDTPGHGNFILAPNSPYDWRSPQNDNLWQGVNGTNNPCPTGYRIPTEAELNAERASWSSSNSAGAFASPLKLPVAGGRGSSSGSLYGVGSYGGCWSSTVVGTFSRGLFFNSSAAFMSSYYRAVGRSVRCLKDGDTQPTTYALTLQVTPAGTGQVAGAGEYAEGTTVTITATPNSNYQFVNWTGDTDHVTDASAANTTLTMPAQNITLTANFEEDGGGNGDDTEVVEVLNPATGKTWMDRNLGASRAATSSTDAEAYGDLYQWGRAADGHQKRTSGTTSTLSNSDTPGHGNFITVNSSPYDWRSPQNTNLWQGVNGTNNPCPAGYRLPTEAELNAERLSWSSNNSAGAFNSPLKLPVAGFRDYSYGSLFYVGSLGYYWSSTVDGTYSRGLLFTNSIAYMNSYYRACGFSVRCLKDGDTQPTTYALTLRVTPAGTGQVAGAGEYAEGTTVTITATPNSNYQFVNWTGDTDHIADTSAANTTLTMPAQNITLTANFEEDGGGNGQPGEGVTDIDGNFYPSVIIGNQEWMAENLRVTRDANGNDITRYCYDNDAANCNLYGGLYTWHTVMNGATSSNTNPSNVQGICPTGWHVPSDAEWTELVDYVVAQGYPNSNVVNGAGNALKSCRQVSSPLGGDCATSEHPLWNSHSTHYGTDEFGFSALPGGRRHASGGYFTLGIRGYWWSSTENSTADAWGRTLYYSYGNVFRYSYYKDTGFSVRCVRDN